MKPSNIYFDSHMDIKIGDFGLSRELNIDRTSQNHGDVQNGDEVPPEYAERTDLVGTYLYLAPEVLRSLVLLNPESRCCSYWSKGKIAATRSQPLTCMHWG